MNDEDLPEGWAVVPLEVLVEHILGGDWGIDVSDRKPGWSRAKVIRGTDFKNWVSQRGATAPTRAIKESSLQKRRLKPGDLVLEVSGGGPDQPVGRSLLVDESTLSGSTEPFVCSNFCRQVRLKSGVDSALVNLFLRWQYAQGGLDRFQNQTTNLRNLQVPELLAGMMVLLPPIAEQKRITAKLEELLVRVNAARDRLAHVPAILKRFRQAVLAAACDGWLTADWRSRHPATPSATRGEEGTLSELPESWAWTLAGRIGAIQGGIQKQPKRAPKKHAYPYLRVANVYRNRLDLSLVEKMELFEGELDTYRLREGDLLVVEGNGSASEIGRAALWTGEIPDCVHQNHIIRVRPSGCAPRFLNLYWNSPLGSERIAEVAVTTAGLYNLSTRKIAALPVPLPPRPEQDEIVRRVEALFKLADTIEKRVAAATARAEKLTQATLAKAFRGELVPTEAELARREGRTYEPASTLLERVRTESAGADTRGDGRLGRAIAADVVSTRSGARRGA